MDSYSEEDFNREIARAKDQFKVITELKEKLEILTEHVQSRKEALDEEIEESLHEAIAHSKDCLEKIQENIEPKVEAVIKEKLEQIDSKVLNWKDDFRSIVREEMEKEAEPLSRKVAEELDIVVSEKIWSLQEAMQQALKADVPKQVQTEVTSLKAGMDEQVKALQSRILIAIGVAGLAVAGTLTVYLMR